MSMRMLIDARHPEETRVAVVKGNRISILVNGTAVTNYVDSRNLFASGHVGLEHHDPQTRIPPGVAGCGLRRLNPPLKRAR